MANDDFRNALQTSLDLLAEDCPFHMRRMASVLGEVRVYAAVGDERVWIATQDTAVAIVEAPPDGPTVQTSASLDLVRSMLLGELTPEEALVLAQDPLVIQGDEESFHSAERALQWFFHGSLRSVRLANHWYEFTSTT